MKTLIIILLVSFFCSCEDVGPPEEYVHKKVYCSSHSGVKTIAVNNYRLYVLCYDDTIERSIF